MLVRWVEWANDGKGHLLHAQQNGHRTEPPLKCEIHQGCMQDVVLMMAKGNLGAAEFLRKVEDLLATIPRAEKTRGLLLVGNMCALS